MLQDAKQLLERSEAPVELLGDVDDLEIVGVVGVLEFLALGLGSGQLLARRVEELLLFVARGTKRGLALTMLAELTRTAFFDQIEKLVEATGRFALLRCERRTGDQQQREYDCPECQAHCATSGAGTSSSSRSGAICLRAMRMPWRTWLRAPPPVSGVHCCVAGSHLPVALASFVW